ncbi:recombination protein NinB [uncultured Ruegeria sp.]|uniref:recombination protein NinB n=1 Tax=uncultured Ruegeria sp. TaxID=259304 RepID=UPI0026390724|nr:recombination protein NinB [uncultured Ruegeria sp.]
MPATVVLDSPAQREKAKAWCGKAPDGTIVTLKKPGRTIPQNDRMWALLTDVSAQAVHNGKRYTTDQWKALFCHACGHEIQFIQGLNDEPFPAGFRTSKMTKEQMSDLLEFIFAYGAEHGIKWSNDYE